MQPIRICHVIYRLDYGGLETGLVNLINHLPPERWSHSIVCLAGHSDFAQRLRCDVPILDCPKREGQDLGLFPRLWRLFRELRPQVLHTRNLSTLEAQLPGALAGIPVRVHGEHGHDIHDLDNRKARYRLLRQVFRPLVTHYTAVSGVLETYLREEIGVPASRLRRICNGVDTARFAPQRAGARGLLPAALAAPPERLIVGAIGRMQPVKDHVLLCRAFIELVRREPAGRDRLGLVIVGDGAQREICQALLAQAGMADLAWLPGTRDDTPALLNAFDVFVLPSLAEGISNTVLEAMATGLPVIATDVGGNPELVDSGRTGQLVPRGEVAGLVAALETYLHDSAQMLAHGRAARERAEQRFSLQGMVEAYDALYASLTRKPGTTPSGNDQRYPDPS